VLLLVIVISLVGILTGTLGQILEIAAGVAIGLFLFAVGAVLALSYFLRHRFRRAARDWERSQGGGPPSPYGGP
jgi:Kef-type K+ transport system membrane component KefB